METAALACSVAVILVAFAAGYAALVDGMRRLEASIESLSGRIQKSDYVSEQTYRNEVEIDDLYRRYNELVNDTRIGGDE